MARKGNERMAKVKTLTVGEMKARNKAAGYNWFDNGTMKFFGTKIESAPNAKGIFITSEYNFDRTKRLYTLRKFESDSTVTTIGEFQAYNTKSAALAARKGL